MKRDKKKVLARREELLKVALKLFSKQGYGETSFQNIADACGVSQSAVVHHFPKKLDLFREVLQRVVVHNHELVGAMMQLPDSARTRLEKHFLGNLTWATEHRDESRIILLLYYFAAFHPEFTGLYAKAQAQARHRIAELLAAGVREKEFPASLDVVAAAEMLHDALLGGIVNTITVPAAVAPSLKEKMRRWKDLITAVCAAK